MRFVCTGRIGQWDVYELGSGSYVRTGRRTTRKGSTERTPTQMVEWVALKSRHPASGLPSSSSQQGEGVQDVFIRSFLRRVVMHESKENQPDIFGDAPVSKDNQPNSFGEDAPVTRREMERWERDGRIEMETRERHIRHEFKEVQCQLGRWRARSRR